MDWYWWLLIIPAALFILRIVLRRLAYRIMRRDLDDVIRRNYEE